MPTSTAFLATHLRPWLAADDFTAPVKRERATLIQHPLQLRAPALHARFCAGERNPKAIGEFLLS